ISAPHGIHIAIRYINACRMLIAGSLLVKTMRLSIFPVLGAIYALSRHIYITSVYKDGGCIAVTSTIAQDNWRAVLPIFCNIVSTVGLVTGYIYISASYRN